MGRGGTSWWVVDLGKPLTVCPTSLTYTLGVHTPPAQQECIVAPQD